MSEIKKINYKSISNALTNKQLKNILGGSGYIDCQGFSDSETCNSDYVCAFEDEVQGRCTWVGWGTGDGRCACFAIIIG